MKKILILLLSIISFVGYGQTLINPLGQNTVSNINDANTKPTPVSGTDTYTATLPGTGYATGSAFFTYITDRVVTLKFSNAATSGPWTLNLNGEGAKALKKKNSSGTVVDIVSTDIPAANTILPFRYNGTYFVLEGGSNPDLSGYQPLDSDLTAIAGLSPSNDDIIQRKSGAWANRTLVQILADLFPSQTQNTFYGAPNGSSGVPTFRAIVAADIPNTAVTPGSYTLSNITIDAQGRITAASNGSAGGTGDMVLANVQTVTGAKTFGTIGGAVGKLIIAGSTSGSTILDATPVAGSGTVTLPTTGTLSTLAGTETLTNKTLTSPTLTTPALGTPVSGVGTNITGIVGTNVTNTPSGGIVATTSQAAINELDTEKGTYGNDFTNVVTTLGVDNTGVSDIGAAINTAISAGTRKFYFPAGTYLVTTAITLVDNVIIVGSGRATSTIKLTSNISAIATGRYNTFREIGFLGTYGSGGNTSQKAIVMTSVIGCEVVDCKFSFIAGYGVHILTAPISPPVNGLFFGNKVTGCTGDTNNCGVFCDVRGEYNVISNNTFVDGNMGIRIAGGNNLVSNNNLTVNSYGLYYEGGTNNAHGMCIGNIVNHSGTANLYVTSITLGQQFVDNNFYAGNITLLTSDGITITGGDIEAGTSVSKSITVTTCTNTRFIDNKFTVTPTFTVTGVDPTIVSPHFLDQALSLYDASTATRFDILNINGAGKFNVTDPSTQDIDFNALIVGKTATAFDRTRDLSVGSMRVDGGSSTADIAQFYKTSSTGATLSVLDNAANYGFAVMPTGRVALGFGAAASPTANAHIGPGSAAANHAPLKLSSTHIVTTAASGTGSVATLTYGSTSPAPFRAGQTVTITGVTPSGYNGTYVLLSSNGTTITYTNATTGSQTVAGLISTGLLTTTEPGTVEYDRGFYATSDALNRAAVGGAISDLITDVSNTSTTETDLYTYTTKASTLAEDGEKLIADYTTISSDATADSQYKIYFGGTTIYDSGVRTTTTGTFNYKVVIMRTGSTTAKAIVTATQTITLGSAGPVATETDLTGLTFTNTNILKLTGQASGASGGTGDLTDKMGTIFWWPAAHN